MKRITNAEMVRASLDLIHEISDDYGRRLDELADSSISDDEYDAEDRALYAAKTAEQAPLWTIYEAYGYPSTRSEWFARFVDSFGECDSRKITVRQADVIVRNGGCQTDSRGHITYGARIGSYFVRARVFSDCGYLYVARLREDMIQRVHDRAERNRSR